MAKVVSFRWVLPRKEASAGTAAVASIAVASVALALSATALLGCASAAGSGAAAGGAARPAASAKDAAAKNMTAAETVQAARERLVVREPTARTKKRPLILVHYMPWFESPPVSSGYGYHWHMGGGVFDPYTTGNDGKANIASHYYPLTGPYDSRDPVVLEYQAALMILAGIDGAIFDWYGMDDALDYKSIHESTQAMVKVLKRSGLGFAVCWEDRSIAKMVEAKAVPRDGSLEAGKKVMGWLANNWFRDSSYVKIEGRPLLLCFGPQFYIDPRLWPRLFEGITSPPFFVGLDDHNEAATDGSYNWPPMWASVGGTLTPLRLVDYLNEFYAGAEAAPHLVATAFPGFHDAYREAGAGASYGYLDYADGEIFDLTMDAALASKPDVIQIATWNDYGEGTIIEPTIERGFRELEYLQRLRKETDPAFPYGPADLRAALELYKRKAAAVYADSPKASAAATTAPVDAAYAALFARDAAGFRAALAAAGISSSLEAAPVLRTPGVVVKGSVIPDIAASVAVGKKNLAKGQPVQASSVIYEFVATKAVDGEVLSYWEGGSDTYPNTLTVDLGSVRSISGLVVRLNPKKVWGARTQKFEVSTSTDGSAFSIALPSAEYRFDPAVNANVVAVPFGSSLTLAAKARWVRLTFTANTGAKAGQVAELEIYGE